MSFSPGLVLITLLSLLLQLHPEVAACCSYAQPPANVRLNIFIKPWALVTCLHPGNSSAMASIPAELRRSAQRRDSSSSTSSNKRRPRLLRASATEPSITTSNASRGPLASPQSNRRATDLLSQVAFICGSPPESLLRGSSPPSSQSPVYVRAQREDREDSISSSPPTQCGSLDDIRPYQCWCLDPADACNNKSDLAIDSGRYFSFPSFDTWEVDQPEKDDEENKVP